MEVFQVVPELYYDKVQSEANTQTPSLCSCLIIQRSRIIHHYYLTFHTHQANNNTTLKPQSIGIFIENFRSEFSQQYGVW